MGPGSTIADMAVAQRMTNDEFLATYTEETPGRTIQLIAGEVVVNQPTAAEAAEFDVSLELERDETLSSPLLPGFALPVAAIFPA